MLTEPLRKCFFEQICKGSFGMLEKRSRGRFFMYVIVLPSYFFFFTPHYADNVAFIFEKMSLFTTSSTRSRTSSSVVLT